VSPGTGFFGSFCCITFVLVVNRYSPYKVEHLSSSPPVEYTCAFDLNEELQQDVRNMNVGHKQWFELTKLQLTEISGDNTQCFAHLVHILSPSQKIACIALLSFHLDLRLLKD
jgi:hypothetical protein